MARARVAILISGRGSNMKALIEAAKAVDYPAEIALVVSNVPGAGGLDAAQAAGIATAVIDHNGFGKGAAGRLKFEAAMTGTLLAAEIDFVCLAGFMRLLSADFVAQWRGRLINIHPSLLPAFKGLDVHAEMLRSGVKIAGCTVHFVSAEMDAGPIIGQAAAPVLSTDTVETLAARILALEHRLYPECLRLVTAGLARLTDDGRVQTPPPDTAGALLNPQAPRG